MKTLPGKPPWSPRYWGYSAKLDRNCITIIGGNMAALRECHKLLFPGARFDPKKCHPAEIRRTK